MVSLAKALCAEVSGSVFAYTQSDEISILMQDFESVGTQPWFDGEVQKIASVAASFAAAWFNNSSYGVRSFAHFDARVFTIPEPVEVANYFIWRQRDAMRNAILAYAQHEFGAKAIQGISTSELRVMLDEQGVQIVHRYGMGVIVDKDHITHEDGTQRSFWATFIAPPLNCEPGFYLSKAIPPLPTLSADVDVLQDAEGEHEDGQAQPAQTDPAGDADSGTDQQDRGDDVKDHGKHGA